MADAGYDATPQTPDATMTSVEVIQMPEDVPPAPEAVVEVQATFGGVTTDDAHDAEWEGEDEDGMLEGVVQMLVADAIARVV